MTNVYQVVPIYKNSSRALLKVRASTSPSQEVTNEEIATLTMDSYFNHDIVATMFKVKMFDKDLENISKYKVMQVNISYSKPPLYGNLLDITLYFESNIMDLSTHSKIFEKKTISLVGSYFLEIEYENQTVNRFTKKIDNFVTLRDIINCHIKPLLKSEEFVIFLKEKLEERIKERNLRMNFSFVDNVTTKKIINIRDVRNNPALLDEILNHK